MNTFKTILGFLVTLLEKYTPLKFSKNSIYGIYNYLKVGERFTTSGQPTEKQFSLIRDAGYRKVINLAPANAENSLKNESALLDELGLAYIHIPVNFKKPTDKNFQDFAAALSTSDLDETWIHCAANMRVSAFVYRYRCEVLNENAEEAKKDIKEIWEPRGVWKKFISKT